MAEYQVIYNRAKCLRCGEILESRSQHDSRTCSCGNVMVDGGKEYIRRAVENLDLFLELSETVSVSWVDNDVMLDFDVPESLKPLIQELERLDEEDDYSYFVVFEALDDGAKELVRKGILSEEQWGLLVAKYGDY